MTKAMGLVLLVGLLGCDGGGAEDQASVAGAAGQAQAGASGAAAGGSGNGAGGGVGAGAGGVAGVGAGSGAGGGSVQEVSLRDDLVPLMDRSCALSACHTNDSYVYPKLGPSKDTPASTTHGALLTHTSHLAPERTVVVAGDPQKSTLINKLTGTWAGLACEADKACGSKMPPPPVVGEEAKAPPLSEAEIDLFRRWIAEGAKDN